MQFCYNEWAMIEDKKSRGIFFKSRGHFLLPDCETLPKFDIRSEKPTCSTASLTIMNFEEVTCMYI